ncbi:hypothetical protein BC629DRAFT_981272 [Irpex lacteus]|nr:hypothetical protein BC629DRAFT_981272 [Irpex lacteus]
MCSCIRKAPSPPHPHLPLLQRQFHIIGTSPRGFRCSHHTTDIPTIHSTRPNAYGLLKTPFHYHTRGEYSFPRGMTHSLYSVTNHIQVPARNLRSGDSTHLRNRHTSFVVTLHLRPRSPRVRLGSIPCLCHGMNLAPLCLGSPFKALERRTMTCSRARCIPSSRQFSSALRLEIGF